MFSFSFHSREEIDKAVITAGTVCFLMAVVTVILTVVLGGSHIDTDAWLLTGGTAALYVGLGVGVLKKSRIAISLALLWFLGNQIYAFTIFGISAVNSFMTILVALALIRGTLAIFQYHKKYNY